MARINELTVNHVRVVKLNLDAVCQLDIQSGVGIRLDSVEMFDKKNKNEKIMTGLMSPHFGTDFSDETAFKERYRCKCGNRVIIVPTFRQTQPMASRLSSLLASK